MRIAVIQAYQILPPNIEMPMWVQTCLESVRGWAKSRGFSYEFISDGFLGLAPEWFIQRCGKHVYPVTDLARLYLLKRYLMHGYDRVIWLDADVLVFDPDHFDIDPTDGCAFGYGLMVGAMPDGTVHVGSPEPHNGVIVMTRDHPLLDFYIYAIESIIRQSNPDNLPRNVVGPEFLKRLSQALPLECITSIGWLTPALQLELAVGESRLAECYARNFGFPLAAADLCHFFRATVPEQRRGQYDIKVALAVQVLLDTRGEIINKFLAAH